MLLIARVLICLPIWSKTCPSIVVRMDDICGFDWSVTMVIFCCVWFFNRPFVKPAGITIAPLSSCFWIISLIAASFWTGFTIITFLVVSCAFRFVRTLTTCVETIPLSRFRIPMGTSFSELCEGKT